MAASGLKVLIIGGGFSGMSAAIQLRKAGADVDLVEIDPGWRSYGAGITPRRRDAAGVARARRSRRIPEARRRGRRRRPVTPSAGHQIASLPTPRLAGPDVPGGGAIMRPGARRHSGRGDARLRREGAARRDLRRRSTTAPTASTS